MYTLNKHLARAFLVTFLMTLVVVTFVMCIGIVFKVTDLIAQGMNWRPVVKILIYGFPQALTYSIPVSMLTSSLLVFGRLSADGEITAMKATGISMWRIIVPPVIIAIFCTVICLYINNELVPRGHFARRLQISRMGAEAPLELLEEGRFIQDFTGLTIYIGQKKGKLLGDVRIYDLRKKGIKREVRATSGFVRQGETAMDLILDLFDVRIDPFADDRPGAAYAEKWSIAIPKAQGRRIYVRKKDDKAFRELTGDIRHTAEVYPQLSADDLVKQRMSLRVELHKRFVLSAACLAFVFIGIPLGVKAHRKESSVGVGLSLLLVLNFYLFIIVAESLEKHPNLLPHMIAWLPIVLSIAIGTKLINRNN
ncbi:MAG: LptF/LptG family permease [Verrucomicrobia bacterium]|nr:LptF/LptG family permease [Verrucomicrobiota bacterium]